MPMPDDTFDPLPLDHFAVDARGLDLEQFRAKHGNGFLLREGPLEAARKPRRPQRTEVVSFAPSAVSRSPSLPTPAAPLVRTLLVFSVRHTGRSPYPRIVTVGRTRNNDIILADVAISKFHALLKEEEGRFWLQDAGSRNGTFLDGERVPDTKNGKPLELRQGAKVRFGDLEVTFTDAVALRDLAQKRAR
jgi:hypothetical protein